MSQKTVNKFIEKNIAVAGRTGGYAHRFWLYQDVEEAGFHAATFEYDESEVLSQDDLLMMIGHTRHQAFLEQRELTNA